MSLPTKKDLERLNQAAKVRDDEAFHSIFDDLIEEKLRILDKEWMNFMSKFYDDSDMSRWCA